VNDWRAGSATDFHVAADFDVTLALHPGSNLLAVSVVNSGNEPNPAGMIALLRIEFTEGDPLVIVTDSSWRAASNDQPHWTEPGFNDTSWVAARQLGPSGMAPWGEIRGPEDRRLAARMLRRSFTVEKPVRHVMAYICGLGLSEFYLNGQKVGDHVLAPALTDYSKRDLYETFDVSPMLRRGSNAVGVLLGNGRFYAPRTGVPIGTTSYGFPKLLFQLHLEYIDGSSSEVVSDGSWRLSTDGPIQANNEYDGEVYDARKEVGGWSAPAFDDSGWTPAQLVAAPGGELAAEMVDPIRVVQTLKPVALTQTRPGIYVFDMGQNMVGWCRLRVTGPRGTEVNLRHAETLRPDGTLYTDNLRSAKCTDTYVLKGAGTEVYEPRFTYHGFRYVELTGYPGKPTLATLEGRVVHDDVANAGEFTCSNPLLNRVYRNIRWGVAGNYRSLPTDCPQRDERQGWLGDRSAESKGETYLFNTLPLYRKWLQDMEDAQKESGSVPDVCPAYWPMYSDNVTWPSSTVIIPGTLREQFADTEIIQTHYASARKWIHYMSGFITNGLVSRDSYGDWCVPPEEQKMILSNDPLRKTDKTLLATAYFYYDLQLMARYARLLGQGQDARRFQVLGNQLKEAFNQKFLKPDLGQYDNGSQTSCVLPLAFDLVPTEQRQRVFDHLVDKIVRESGNHVGTGLVGGQWLMRVLSDNGRADLAYMLASQSTYPSWGYMVGKDATTIWELWNGDTADPAMNSGNHVMLVGDLVTWLYEYLAGIKPDPDQPGFKHIIMRPEPVGDLRFVRASHHSPYGLIMSDWTRDRRVFRWKITVPANTTATIYVPARTPNAVRESGKVADKARGVNFLKFENGRASFTLGSGGYDFQSRL
jgi:alpha-L-rhamnosidase